VRGGDALPPSFPLFSFPPFSPPETFNTPPHIFPSKCGFLRHIQRAPFFFFLFALRTLAPEGRTPCAREFFFFFFSPFFSGGIIRAKTAPQVYSCRFAQGRGERFPPPPFPPFFFFFLFHPRARQRSAFPCLRKFYELPLPVLSFFFFFFFSRGGNP